MLCLKRKLNNTTSSCQWWNMVLRVTENGSTLTSMSQTNLLKLDIVQSEALTIMLETSKDTPMETIWFMLDLLSMKVSQLVSWYFEPSQPQRVTSWLKTMFNLSPIYSARKSSNHKLSINHKISHDTNLHKTKHTQTSDKKCPRISPFGITPVEKHIRLGHAGIVDHSVDLSIPDLKKKVYKRNGQKQLKKI